MNKPWPATAEDLMRSRFQAFKHNDADWLLASWHESTRPEVLELDEEITWRGLQIVDVHLGGSEDSEGYVEFRATYLPASPEGGEVSNSGSSTRSGVEVLHERSHFVRENGRWFYVDGVQH